MQNAPDNGGDGRSSNADSSGGGNNGGGGLSAPNNGGFNGGGLADFSFDPYTGNMMPNMYEDPFYNQNLGFPNGYSDYSGNMMGMHHRGSMGFGYNGVMAANNYYGGYHPRNSLDLSYNHRHSLDLSYNPYMMGQSGGMGGGSVANSSKNNPENIADASMKPEESNENVTDLPFEDEDPDNLSIEYLAAKLGSQSAKAHEAQLVAQREAKRLEETLLQIERKRQAKNAENVHNTTHGNDMFGQMNPMNVAQQEQMQQQTQLMQQQQQLQGASQIQDGPQDLQGNYTNTHMNAQLKDDSLFERSRYSNNQMMRRASVMGSNMMNGTNVMNPLEMTAGRNNPYGNTMGGGSMNNQNPYGNAMGGMNNQMMMNNQIMMMMQQQQQQQQQQFQSQMQHMNMQGGGMMMQGGNQFGQSLGYGMMPPMMNGMMMDYSQMPMNNNMMMNNNNNVTMANSTDPTKPSTPAKGKKKKKTKRPTISDPTALPVIPPPKLKNAVLAPRRPLSAYNIFFSEMREIIIKEQADETDEGPDDEEKKDEGAAEDVTDDKDVSKEDDNTAVKQDETDNDTNQDSTKKDMKDFTKALIQRRLTAKQHKRVHRKTHGKIKFTTLAQTVGRRWKELPEEKKQKYKDLAELDRERYKKEKGLIQKQLRDAAKAIRDQTKKIHVGSLGEVGSVNDDGEDIVERKGDGIEAGGVTSESGSDQMQSDTKPGDSELQPGVESGSGQLKSELEPEDGQMQSTVGLGDVQISDTIR